MPNKLAESYVSKFSMSDPSIISSASSSSQRYSDNPLGASDIGQFDIIDDLDYDDVDDGLIVDQELMFQQREAIIFELIEGEKRYLDTLSTILNTYVLPLRKSLKTTSFGFLGLKKAPCTEKEICWLFSNLDELYQVHYDNLTVLSERLKIWGPTQIISDIVQTRLTKLKQPYHNYFDQYDMMVTTFERLSRYAPFKKYIESIDKSSKGTVNLLSLLQAPVKCIQQYMELFKSLSENTSSMHPDYIGLMQCKHRIISIFAEFKPKIEDAHNVNKVYQIHSRLAGHPYGTRVDRRFILQDNFSKKARTSSTNVVEDLTYFLFSDILVFAKSKPNCLQYKGHVNLERAKVKPISVGKEFSVELMSPYQGVDSLNTTFMGTPYSHVIRTSTKAEQTKWIHCLELVISKLNQKQQSK